MAQLFNAKTIKVVEDTTKKLRIVEHLQVSLCLSLYISKSYIQLSRSWPRRQNTLLSGWIVTEREKTLGSR